MMMRPLLLKNKAKLSYLADFVVASPHVLFTVYEYGSFAPEARA